MTGTGEVFKRRLRDGLGEFPIDCALEDTTMRLHYRVRPLQTEQQQGGTATPAAASSAASWVFDSRVSGAAATPVPPIEFDTGA